jgi:hypothetical protein
MWNGEDLVIVDTGEVFDEDEDGFYWSCLDDEWRPRWGAALSRFPLFEFVKTCFHLTKARLPMTEKIDLAYISIALSEAVKPDAMGSIINEAA